MKRLLVMACAACLMQAAMAQNAAGGTKAATQAPIATQTAPTTGASQAAAPPQGTPTTPASGAQTTPATGAQTTPGTSGQAAPQASGAAKNSAPQAKSKEEFDAYQAAAAGTDPNAADEFAKKFPTSDLRALLYVNMMRKYQSANDAEHTVQMGRKAVAIEPNNTVALVTVASVLAERTRSTDLDKDERYAEANKDADTAINTIDTGLVVPASVTPEQLVTVKGMLLSMAYAAKGNVSLEQGQYAEAEKSLNAAVTANKGPQQDAVTYLRLAIAQDKQNKLKEAMVNVNKALELSAEDPQVSAMVKQEKTRLEQLSGAK